MTIHRTIDAVNASDRIPERERSFIVELAPSVMILTVSLSRFFRGPRSNANLLRVQEMGTKNTGENSQANSQHAQDDTGEVAETLIGATADHDDTQLELELDFLGPAERTDEIGRLGGYRILEVVGSGAMGIVFRAEELSLKRLVALKALRPTIALSPEAKKRFLREAEATAAIEHDHIVTTFQVGEDDGIPFIAMQYLAGDSLEALLEQNGRFEQRDAVRIGYQVALGLAAAHECGLIHRDIKPDNILLDERQDRVKIVDFGLARSVGEHEGLTINGMVLGTPKYMSPEQANGAVVDHRSDLFSLGSVLYHLVTGGPPFVGGNLTATLMAVASLAPEPLLQSCPDLNPELAVLISRLMAKDPEQRPNSAAEVAAALEQIDLKLTHSSDDQSSPDHFGVRSPLSSVHELCSSVSPQSAEERETPEHRKDISKPLWWSAALLVVVCLTVGVLWAAGIIFTIEAKKGTLTVLVEGDEFATTVQGREVTIQNTSTGELHTIALEQLEQQRALAPGSYLIINTDAKLSASPKSFTIQDGKESAIRVDWSPVSTVAGVGQSEEFDRESRVRELLSSAILVYNFEKGTYAPDNDKELPKTLHDIGPGKMWGVFEGFVTFDESIAGQAYVCDGSGCAVRISGLEPLMPESNDTVTVSFWHRTEKAKLGMMFDCGAHTLGGFDIVSLPDTRYQINFEGNHLYSQQPYDLGEWRHVAVVFDRPTVSLYVNGAQAGTWSLNPPNNDQTWESWGRLGGQVKALRQESRYFHGLIDEVVILPHAASMAEIDLLYKWTKAGQVLPSIANDAQ